VAQAKSRGMSAVFEAHQRLLALLPVRTHEHKYIAPAREERDDDETRRERIRELVAKGVKKRHIPAILGISRTAVQKHLRAIKRGK
jgi:hypothetical protein